jgi:tetratricopeptide (TPR) repeat protein
MLVREDRAAEGLPHLERAHERQPAGHEIQVNLIVAHGKLGHLERALALFREARAEARPEEVTSLLNAAGYVSYLNAAPAEAEKYLEESLKLQPDQPEVLALLQSVRASAER